jgi:hypothetical protein
MSLTAEKAWKLVKQELGYIEENIGKYYEGTDLYIIKPGTWEEFPNEGDFETEKLKVECITGYEHGIHNEIFSVFKVIDKTTGERGIFRITGEHDSWSDSYWTEEFDKVEKATKTVEYWKVIE